MYPLLPKNLGFKNLFKPDILFLVVHSMVLKHSTIHSPLEAKCHREG